MKSDIRAVVLDVDGTLCSLTKGVGEIYAELLGEEGFAVDAIALSRAARTEWGSFQDLYLNTQNQNQTTHDREREAWCEFVRRVLVAAELSQAAQPKVIRSIYDAFASKRYRSIEPGAIDFLTKARARGLLVVAATNNDERSKVTLRELGVSELLSGVFVAGDLLWKKPSPNFFKALEAQLQCEPSSLVHVGNNYALDVEPARQRGWGTVLFGSSAHDETPSVRDFVELRSVLRI